VVLRLAVFIQYRRVSHRQTHRHDDGYYPWIASAVRVMTHDTNVRIDLFIYECCLTTPCFSAVALDGSFCWGTAYISADNKVDLHTCLVCIYRNKIEN